MSMLTTVAKLEADRSGHAERLTTVRHRHLDEHPFVLVPLTLAGEACAPLAAMCGTDPSKPVLLTVHQPRDRSQRFAFAERLAAELLPYIEGCRAETETYERAKEERERATRAPQLLTPNPGGLAYLRLLGRSTRLRRTEGPFAVAESVPTLGKWLTWYADQAEFPGSSLVLSMTTTLGEHWATGQSATEDANLAALLAWIDPPPGLSGAAAARLAEDPGTFPPAGPTTEPAFDASLTRLVSAYDEAREEHTRTAAARVIDEELRRQLAPTWDLMWQGISRLRSLPPGAGVEGRWTEDRIEFTRYATYLEETGFPQARRDHAAGAARRLARMERAATAYESARAFDDPLVMAEYELTGEAFTGTVVARDLERTIAGKRAALRRPLLTLRCEERPGIAAGREIRSTARPDQKAEILSVREEAAAVEVDIQLNGGFTTARRFDENLIPETGEELCYTTLGGYLFATAFPDESETPWTHGGPPQGYVPTDEDAEESWA